MIVMVSNARGEQVSNAFAPGENQGEYLSASDAEAPEPADRWPPWKTLAFIAVYCTAAWSLIGLGIWALLR